MKGVYYTIIICVLLLVALGLLLLVLYLHQQAIGCITNPNFWCWDDWVCPAGTQKAGKKPSEIYGINSALAQTATYCTDPNAPCNCDWMDGQNACMSAFCTKPSYTPAGEWNPYSTCKSATS